MGGMAWCVLLIELIFKWVGPLSGESGYVLVEHVVCYEIIAE